MAEETREMEVLEQETVQTNGTERMRPRTIFVPRTDIYQTEENIFVTVDMPGASEDSIDITLEKSVLTITGSSTYGAPDGYSLAFAEFQAGDYERSFRLTDQIDWEGIEASYRDGVLQLTLPIAEVVKARKISVKAE